MKADMDSIPLSKNKLKKLARKENKIPNQQRADIVRFFSERVCVNWLRPDDLAKIHAVIMDAKMVAKAIRELEK